MDREADGRIPELDPLEAVEDAWPIFRALDHLLTTGLAIASCGALLAVSIPITSGATRSGRVEWERRRAEIREVMAAGAPTINGGPGHDATGHDPASHGEAER